MWEINWLLFIITIPIQPASRRPLQNGSIKKINKPSYKTPHHHRYGRLKLAWFVFTKIERNIVFANKIPACWISSKHIHAFYEPFKCSPACASPFSQKTKVPDHCLSLLHEDSSMHQMWSYKQVCSLPEFCWWMQWNCFPSANSKRRHNHMSAAALQKHETQRTNCLSRKEYAT